MVALKGLNGTQVFTANDVPVGRTPAGNLITVDVRMEQCDKAKETVDHESWTTYLTFSACSNTWQRNMRDIESGGQHKDDLVVLASGEGTFLNGWDAEKISRFLELWDKWHLNDMQAACSHQTPTGKDASENLSTTPACPISGYEYGHSWLLKPLPVGFLDEIKALFAGCDQSKIYIAE